MDQNVDIVAFGGGCFWCTEAVFLQLNGVTAVTSGYAGGATEHPTYDEVSMGNTGHAEVIEVRYDPSIISFQKLLEVFFASHDPTTHNRQGNDVGTQYRSIILYTTDQQREKAQSHISSLEASKKYQNPIVTEVQPLGRFYPAEEYHKTYFEKNPEQQYSKVVIAPKVKKVRETYPGLLKGQS